MITEPGLRPVKESGWRYGFANLVRKELRAWFATRMWWSQVLIWTFLIQGLLLNSLAHSHGGPPALDFLSVGMSWFAALAVIILAHNAIIGEKQSGTAAWIMSKPVSRPAFILSKLIGLGVSVVGTVVVLQGAIAFAVLVLAGRRPPAGPYVAALGMTALYLVFFLALALLLGTLVNSRGAVLGVPLILVFLFSLENLQLPSLGAALLPSGHAAIGVSVSTSGASHTTAALAAAAVFAVVTAGFIAGMIARFTREEF
jgi:ABC-2 type transport system permease protein